jgi:hypothetical protein
MQWQRSCLLPKSYGSRACLTLSLSWRICLSRQIVCHQNPVAAFTTVESRGRVLGAAPVVGFKGVGHLSLPLVRLDHTFYWTIG